MRKKLIGLAVASALAAPLAVQAQGSNVQIYGLLQPSVDFVDNGDDTGTSMADNNSRLGFKGSEDLGNGLKAIFQLESAVDFDDRSGTGWTRRDSWVGLAGSFGSLVAGTKFTAYKSSTDFIDPFGDTIGDYNNVFGVPAFDSDGFNDRFTNGLHYTSPNFGGFNVALTYGLNEDADSDGLENDGGDNNDDSWSAAVTYKLGGVTLVAAYEDQENRIFENTKAFKVGGGYTFAFGTTITAMYAKEDFGDAPGIGDLKRDLAFVAAKHKLGNIDLMASFTWADDFDDLDDSAAKAWALGAAYNFSKRTNIGAYYAQVSNDDNAGFGFDSGYAPSDVGENVKGISIRMRHAF